MRRFAERHPWAAAIAIAAGLIALTAAFRPLIYHGAAGAPRLAYTWLAVVVEAAIGLAIVGALRWWRACGFTPVAEWQDRWLLAILWIPVGVALLAFFGGVHAGAGAVLMLAGLSLMIGVNEETWFRGLVLRLLLPTPSSSRNGREPRRVVIAMVGSAVLFGVVHVGNLLAPGSTALGVGYQMISASLIGMFFAGLRLRMNAIWPLMAAHALIDFPVLATTYSNFHLGNPPIPALIFGLGINLIFAIVGLILGRGAVGARVEDVRAPIPSRRNEAAI